MAGEEPSAEDKLVAAGAIGEEAVMADAVESVRQGMQEKAADELVGFERHHLVDGAPSVVLPSEADLAVGQRDQATVGNGDTMGVAAQIGQHLFGSADATDKQPGPSLVALRRGRPACAGPSRLAQLRTSHSNTSTVVVLRLSISNKTSGIWKMRKHVIAAATAIMLATAVYGGAASAGGGGGGGAEPMPLTNFTDMPSYHLNPVRCPRWVKCVGKYARWHQTSPDHDQRRNACPDRCVARHTGKQFTKDRFASRSMR